MVRNLGLREVVEDVFALNSNSLLIDTIAFGYIIHTMLVESELYENNEWYDFSFGIHYKIIDSNEECIFLKEKEIELLYKWLDWICRVVIESEGKHHSNKNVKTFLSNCDTFFSYIKGVNNNFIIQTEKKQ